MKSIKLLKRQAGTTERERKDLNIDDPVRPVLTKLVLADYTQEALVEHHSNNLRGIAVVNDELAGWIKNFNRYNSGSEQEFWLHAFNGSPINTVRKSGRPIYIERSHISVCGNIQPYVTATLAQDGRDGTGFLDRFLFAAPEDLKKPYPSKAELPDDVADIWERIVFRILDIDPGADEEGGICPSLIRYSDEAQTILEDFLIMNADRSNDTDNDILKGIYAKLDNYTVRFSLILQMLRWACGEATNKVIDAESVTNALKLTEYYRRMNERIRMKINDPLQRMPSLQRKFCTMLPEPFTKTQAIELGNSLNIPTRTYERWLKPDFKLFNRTSQGNYEKRY
jgi:hypothetical protein